MASSVDPDRKRIVWLNRILAAVDVLLLLVSLITRCELDGVITAALAASCDGGTGKSTADCETAVVTAAIVAIVDGAVDAASMASLVASACCASLVDCVVFIGSGPRATVNGGGANVV